MVWLESLVFWTVAGELLLASASAGQLTRLAIEASTRSRRVGAGALAAVNAALALEAALSLLAPRSDLPGEELARAAALVVVRGALFAATAFMSLLVWRHRASRK